MTHRALAGLLAAGLVTASALAQDRGFRDEKSGKIWTPENVGQDGKPIAPEDRAFDPSGQAVTMSSSVENNVRMEIVGRVPMDAGPTVPLVEATDLRLRDSPGGFWGLEVHLSNHSTQPRSPLIRCDFYNGSRTVHEVTASLLPVGPGERVAFTLRGPRAQVFVDSARCFVDRP
jgi:hypothetical protein